MASRRTSDPEPRDTERRVASNPVAREQQLVSLAVDLAEQQLIAGTASAQVISHYLKASSSREYLEQMKLQGEIELAAAKREQMAKCSYVVPVEITVSEGAVTDVGRPQGLGIPIKQGDVVAALNEAAREAMNRRDLARFF